ncbi:MAG: SPASM domain-containing protein [Candidatus Aenigmatarchaeota archaeon]
MNNKKTPQPICYSPFYEMTIFPDGKVAPCCFSDQEKIEEIENVKSKDIEDIWKGNKFRILREKMLTGIYPSMCKECSISHKEMEDLEKLFKNDYKHLTEKDNYLSILNDLLFHISNKYDKYKQKAKHFKARLNEKIEELESEMKRLKEENKEIGEIKEKLESKLDGVNSERDLLKKEVERINEERDFLERTNQQVVSEKEEVEKELEEIKKSLSYKTYKRIKDIFTR